MPTPDTKADSTWSQDNLACRNTYVLLIGLKQLTEPFAQAGKKPMKQLAFWNAAASDTMRQLTATGLATQLDKFYIKVLLAGYEEGYDFHGAIEAMKNALCSADKTVSQLAEVIDGIYNFRGE
jgi:hypothetical protein